MLPFHRVAQDDFLAVNQVIIERLHTNVELVGSIGEHIVAGGGKRLRPLLALISALNCGYSGRDHVLLAAIIEFIHTATLLHDDVVDGSHMRRGRKTANYEWGNAPSVLVGDFLYSRAFQMLVELKQMPIMAVLANTTNTIAEGEVQQLIHAGNPDVTEANYLEVIRKKTAILFEAAAQCGGLIAQAPTPIIEALAEYGVHLGMAFQIQDDVLDYEGEVSALGKNVGDDLAEGKPTLPLIHAMLHGRSEDSALIRDAIQRCDSGLLGEVVEAVHRSGSLAYTRSMAQKHVQKAQTALEKLPKNRFRDAMFELAEFALHRAF